MANPSEPTEFADDLLWGADEIAKFIGRSRIQTYWLIEHGTIPASKIGALLVGSRSTIRQALTASPKVPASAA